MMTWITLSCSGWIARTYRSGSASSAARRRRRTYSRECARPWLLCWLVTEQSRPLFELTNLRLEVSMCLPCRTESCLNDSAPNLGAIISQVLKEEVVEGIDHASPMIRQRVGELDCAVRVGHGQLVQALPHRLLDNALVIGSDPAVSLIHQVTLPFGQFRPTFVAGRRTHTSRG